MLAAHGMEISNAPRWAAKVEPRAGATAQAVSFTQVMKQGGTQRLQSIKNNSQGLVSVSQALARDPLSTAARELACEALACEIAAAWPAREGSAADGAGAGAGADCAPHLLHVDWGGVSHLGTRFLCTPLCLSASLPHLCL